jgi:ribokinase
MTGQIVVLGALHHDVVVDAPGIPRVDETLPGTAVDYRFGGKGGNQALAAAQMGARVSMVGRVGHDPAGGALRHALEGAGVAHDQVSVANAPTGMSVAITLPDGNYGAVIVSGANVENDGRLCHSTVPTTLVIQNEIPETANRQAVSEVHDTCRVIWNAAPARAFDLEIAGRADLLIVNRLEASDLTGLADPRQAASELFSQTKGAVVVTLGSEGALIADNPKPRHLPGLSVAPVSTHGAGDMFVGALAARLDTGDDLDRAITFAQAAAGLFVAANVENRGTINRDTVTAALNG